MTTPTPSIENIVTQSALTSIVVARLIQKEHRRLRNQLLTSIEIGIRVEPGELQARIFLDPCTGWHMSSIRPSLAEHEEEQLQLFLPRWHDQITIEGASNLQIESVKALRDTVTISQSALRTYLWQVDICKKGEIDTCRILEKHIQGHKVEKGPLSLRINSQPARHFVSRVLCESVLGTDRTADILADCPLPAMRRLLISNSAGVVLGWHSSSAVEQGEDNSGNERTQ